MRITPYWCKLAYMQQRILTMYTGSRKYVLLIAICILCGSWTPVNRQTASLHKTTPAYALEVAITAIAGAREPGTTGNFSVGLTLGTMHPEDITISYTVSGTATAGSDYTALSGTIVLPANTNAVQIPVDVMDDKLIEPTESVVVTLTGATTGSPAVPVPVNSANNAATVSITDDDNNINISSTAINAEEGGANGKFTFELPAGVVAANDITIDYTIQGAGVGVATEGADYNDLSPHSIILPAGANKVDLVVTAIDDNDIEGDEDLSIQLNNVTDATGVMFTIGPNIGSGIDIIDNDNRLSITLATNGTEPGGAGNNAGFNISLPGGLTFTQDILVKYNIDNISTATGGPGATYDYDNTTLTGGIVLPAGSNSVLLPIIVNDDKVIEATETISISLTPNASVSTGSPAVNFSLDPVNKSAVANIADDDNTSIAIISTTDGREPGGAGNNGSFRIGWTNGVKAPVGGLIVNFGITGSTATKGAGNDYTMPTSTFIPSGSSYADVTVTVLDDNLVEGPETVVMTLTAVIPGSPSSSPAILIGTPNPATVTIADNDVISSQQWKSAAYTGTGAAGAVTAGDQITYTIHIRNTGNVNLPNVKITDKIPTYTEFVSADGGIVPDATGTLTWTIPSVATGGPDVTRSFVVKVANDLTGATGILNTAGVDNGDGSGEHPTTPPDPGNPNNPHPGPVTPGDPSTNVPVDQSKRSVNWKSAAYTGTGAAGAVKPGDQITYTIHIRNTGHVKLTNVVITDNMPAYTQFVSAEGGIVPDASGKLTWNVTEVPVGSTDLTRSFVVRVVNDLTGATGILNTAGVDNGDGSGEHPTTPPDPNNPNNPQTHPNPGDPSTNVPVDTAKRSVNWKSASYTGTGVAGSVRSGDEITYTIHVRNTGYVKLTDVAITDNIPTYTQFVSAEGGITPDGAGKLTWTITEIPVGSADVTRSFTVKVANDLTNATYIVNTAWVDNGDGGGNHPTGPQNGNDPNQPKPNPDPNDPATEVPVDNGKNSANWKSASYTGSGAAGAVTTGDEITYTIHVRNIGSVTLTNVQITDNVPAYTEFVSAEGGIGPDVTGKLTWTVATIAVGAPDVTRSFTVKVVKDLTGATSIINTAAVDNGNGKGGQPSTPSDPNDPNNPHPHPNPGDPATNIPVGKVSTFDTWKTVTTASGNPKAKAGEILTYTIQVRNTGNVTIPAINITDTVPAHTTFESATDGGIYDRATNAVKWTLSNLALGTVADVTFKVKVSTGLDSSVPVITNTAFVSDGTVTVPTSGCDPASAGCNGHPGTEIETIPDDSDGGLFIVNAMSPNGDGKNEYFIIKGLEKYGKAALYVFNRWGSMVYQSKEYHNDWNGTGLSEGTYFYKLELKETAGGVKLYKGWVVIKRN